MHVNRSDCFSNHCQRQIVQLSEADARLSNIIWFACRTVFLFELGALAAVRVNAAEINSHMILLRRRCSVHERFLVVCIWKYRKRNLVGDHAPIHYFFKPIR